MKKEDLINLKKKVLELKQAGEIEKILKYDTPYRRLKQIAFCHRQRMKGKDMAETRIQ